LIKGRQLGQKGLMMEVEIDSLNLRARD